jgi:hypothetical protein
MADDVEEPIQLTKEPVFDDDEIETTLDPETAFALANLIDSAKAAGLYPFGHTKQALKVDQVANEDQGSIRDFRDSLREQPGVERIWRQRLKAMGIVGTGS